MDKTWCYTTEHTEQTVTEPTVCHRAHRILIQNQLCVLTLSRDFWVLVSYSCPAASTHCLTASPSMLCSLISLRYSSAFWLDFYINTRTGVSRLESKQTEGWLIRPTGFRRNDRCWDRRVPTSYSLWASSSRAPGAMDAILKMSWQTRGTSWSSSWVVELMIRTPSSSPTRTQWSSIGNLMSGVKGQTGVEPYLMSNWLKGRGHMKQVLKPNSNSTCSERTNTSFCSTYMSIGRFLNSSWRTLISFRRTLTMPENLSGFRRTRTHHSELV